MSVEGLKVQGTIVESLPPPSLYFGQYPITKHSRKSEPKFVNSALSQKGIGCGTPQIRHIPDLVRSLKVTSTMTLYNMVYT